MSKERTLSREITATQIPSGDKQTLAAGTKIFLHQTLGGSFTVQTDFGLYRIDGADGDAIGESVADHRVHTETLEDGAPNPEAIWDQLKKVYDPEIPVNIVDLGLVYTMDVEKIDPVGASLTTPSENGEGTPGVANDAPASAEPAPAPSPPAYKVSVAITLTAPGCGMGPAIAEDAKSKILLVPGVSDAEVRITWEPPWNQSMISEEGKMKLGLI
ncbi:metal-sulfur cluster biosynthetic enzyme [Ereboglobus sp. PH5-10]|uniref:iron-sulfur cluster assembly protein n=1 Tax=Ereboglobus sp. PH5-10 TaxID=2940629 RepID=UPI0024062918|nr:iron-sulfur cluster assembly protein [Ereboglobus sp. PH5-10]MDF9828384.1 metal-sulfur cluster biosynthetic enzyme [Ereboglobus sp. PH5-10]